MLFWAKFPDALAFIFIATGIYLRAVFPDVRLPADFRLGEGPQPGVHHHYHRVCDGDDYFPAYRPVLPGGAAHPPPAQRVCAALAGGGQFVLAGFFNLLYILPE